MLSNLDKVKMKVIVAVLIDKSMSDKLVRLGPVLRYLSTRLRPKCQCILETAVC